MHAKFAIKAMSHYPTSTSTWTSTSPSRTVKSTFAQYQAATKPSSTNARWTSTSRTFTQVSSSTSKLSLCKKSKSANHAQKSWKRPLRKLRKLRRRWPQKRPKEVPKNRRKSAVIMTTQPPRPRCPYIRWSSRTTCKTPAPQRAVKTWNLPPTIPIPQMMSPQYLTSLKVANASSVTFLRRRSSVPPHLRRRSKSTAT